MTLANEFYIRYPEFKEVDPLTVGFFIVDAKAELSSSVWGELYKRGLLALVAHLLELQRLRVENGGAPNQTVASESAGALSVSYGGAALSPEDEVYNSTVYGQEYLRLRELVGFGFLVV